MIEITSLDDLGWLSESIDVECKLAAGQDGRGKLPEDFWATYSAFANTHGGLVVLGAKEKDGRFELRGVPDADRVITDLFNNLNNPKQVSVNLLTDAHVRKLPLPGGDVILIEVPAAGRKNKPVYLNGNPLNGNTYRRLHEGDRHCDDETVRRMLAEQVEDERDSRILPNFSIGDIDLDSLRIYRQTLRDRNAAHPFLEYEGVEFLKKIGGWRRDRQTGEQGLTLAGLLMFGQWHAIQEAVPHYFVDYQERPEARSERRWVDRVVPDGTWSGNVFDFYRRVYRKLIVDLKVPFELKAGQRQDDTPVHEALREALVNTLVHADYTGRVSILVVKRPDMFGFRNPGGLRLPLEQVLLGGESDCRNRLMHQMFLMIGLGERAGSGIPKIYSGWQSQHWRPPFLYEKDEPEQTLLELRMLDLLPDTVLAELHARFGGRFDALGYGERLILATATVEQVVTHTRLAEISDKHRHDLTLSLQRLVREGFLVTSGRPGRGTVYHLPGESLPTPDQVFAPSVGAFISTSEHLQASSEHLQVSSEYFTGMPRQRDVNGCLLSPLLDAPVVDDLSALQPAFCRVLETIATEPREKKKLPQEIMRKVILALCRDYFLTLNVLAQIMDRNPDALRQQHLNEMVRNREIRLAFPSTPTHERQAYRATDQ